MPKKSKTEPQKPELPEPSEKEKKAIEQAEQVLKERPPALNAKIDIESDYKHNVSSPHADEVGWGARVLAAMGTNSQDFINEIILGFNNALTPTLQKPLSGQKINAAFAVLGSVQPQNELETMLVTQMIATHHLVMQQMGILKRAEWTEQAQTASNAVNKLLRTYAMQMETLQKMRRGGEQTVRVEHVHVHQGGQAIVGNVTQHKHIKKGGGGGDGTKNGMQAYGTESAAALGLDGSAQMWSQDEIGKAVPVSSGEK